jgi:hypothetical protein
MRNSAKRFASYSTSGGFILAMENISGNKSEEWEIFPDDFF